MEKYLEIIQKTPLFEGVDIADIEDMFKCLSAQIKKYKKDTYIKVEGDYADFIGIVLEGTIQVFTDDYEGNRHITAALTSGQIFAEAFALAGMKTLPVNIYAASDCVILFLDIKKILYPCESCCRFHNQLIQNLLKIVAMKNVSLTKKLRYVSEKTTARKLMAFLNDQAKLNHSREFTINYDRQALADYLGVERSAMSAEISKLKAAGIIETKRNYFKLLK